MRSKASKKESEQSLNQVSQLDSKHKDSGSERENDARNPKRPKSIIQEENQDESNNKSNTIKAESRYQDKSHTPTKNSQPKLSANAQKLKDLEDQMSALEFSVREVSENMIKTRDDKKALRSEIKDAQEAAYGLSKEAKKNLTEKLKEAFSFEFDEASRRVVTLEEENSDLRKQLYEARALAAELDGTIQSNTEEIAYMKDRLTDKQNDLDQLKQAYDGLLLENDELRKSNSEKDSTIRSLRIELDEIKNVIGKLTEVRVILNKYFSSYFENFTPKEKALIDEVTRKLNDEKIEPNQIFAARPFKDDRVHYDNVELNQNANHGRIRGTGGQELKVYNEEEYRNYKESTLNSRSNDKEFRDINMSGKAYADMSKSGYGNVIGSQNQGSRSIGLSGDNNDRGKYNYDDDFWYENRKKK